MLGDLPWVQRVHCCCLRVRPGEEGREEGREGERGKGRGREKGEREGEREKGRNVRKGGEVGIKRRE